MAEVTQRTLTSYSPKRRSTTTNGRTVAVLLKPLIDLHGEPRNWATAVPLYVEALADIPPELLAKAVSLAISGNPFFPKPAELRASIADELEHHRWRQQRERLAALPMPPEPPPPSPEDIEYVDSIVAKTRKILAGRWDALEGDTEPV
jgi:hypothetical protein